MLCENACAFEDAFEGDAGVFFGGAGDGGERADVEVEGGADGVFGGKSGSDGAADGGEGGGGTKGETGGAVDAGECVKGDVDEWYHGWMVVVGLKKESGRRGRLGPLSKASRCSWYVRGRRSRHGQGDGTLRSSLDRIDV